MKKALRYLKRENGSALFIEAAIIYPIVFMCIVFLIYIGMYILQTVTLTAYAQKVAVLAAREVAYPGYLKLVDSSVYNTSAVEADFGDDIQLPGIELPGLNGQNITISRAKIKIKCTFNTDEVEAKAYRYWSLDPLNEDARQVLKNILIGADGQGGIVGNQSVFGTGRAEAEITCSNYVISQTTTVTLTQEIIDIGALSYFGIESPKARAIASATVSDSDELVRNTDFVIDVIDTLADKLGIDLDKMKETVNGALEKIGLA